MISITLSQRFAPFHMEAGIPYVIEDVNAGQLMQIPGLVHHIEKRPLPDIAADYQPGKLILITRPGGIGDLLMLTPLIEQLSRTGHSVHVCTSKTFFPVLASNPHVDGIHEYPMTAADFAQTPNHIWLENAIEGNPDAEHLHMVDVFFKLASQKPSPGLSLHCRVYPNPLPESSIRVHPCSSVVDSSPRHIGLHLTASARNRQYNRGAELLDLLLAQTDYHLHLYGAPGEVSSQPNDRVHNHTQGKKPFTLAQTLDHLATLDGFIGVDSGLLHAAGGLDIPSVSLYAAFPGDLRTRYHKRTAVIQAESQCSPCFHHQRLTAFPAHCPGAGAGRCVVLDAISPQRIIETLKSIL
jgi:ADP-heptose:LPS heptosyltransferase